MKLLFCIAVLLAILELSLCVKEIKVGIILIYKSGSPFDYERTMGALDVAGDTINTEIFDNVTVRLVPIVKKYGPQCDANMAPG